MEDEHCPFCDGKNSEDLKVRFVASKDGKWFAFVPEDPLIFGHILLTIDKGGIEKINVATKGRVKVDCYQDFWFTPATDDEDEKEGVPNEVLKREIVGVKECMEGLRRIPHVERIYLVVAGEDKKVHHHFHLLPRYGFKSFEEREEWHVELNLAKGDPKWRDFYGWPTLGLSHKEGFQYLGELESVYGACKDNEYYPNRPSKALLKEMATKLRTIMKKP